MEKQKVTDFEWIVWARGLLRRCAEAENRLRERFDADGSMGRRDVEFGERLDKAQLRDEIERWAVGNMAARADALRARGVPEVRAPRLQAGERPDGE